MDRRRLLFAAAAAGGLAVAGVSRAEVVTRTVRTLTLENIPEAPPSVREAIRRYQNARSASFQDWLADGSMLITTRFGSTSQLHHVARPEGERFQLTFFDEPIGGAVAQPGSDDRYLFLRDVGGGEYFQGFMAGLTGPEAAVTEPNTRNEDFVFSRDGKLLLWSRVTPGSGDYDVMATYSAPDDTTAAAVALAVLAPGHLRAYKTTKLLSPHEFLEASRKATGAGYQAPSRG